MLEIINLIHDLFIVMLVVFNEWIKARLEIFDT